MMWGYQRNPSWRWENSSADGLAGLVLLVAIVAVAIAITIVVLILREIGRIYTQHALRRDDAIARVLWGSGLGLLGILLVAVATATIPGGGSAGAVIALLGWTAFWIVIETCDTLGRDRQHGDQNALGQLDSYLDFVSDRTGSTTEDHAIGRDASLAVS